MRFLIGSVLIAITASSSAQADSSSYFFKKGEEEKAKGRVMEAYKAFDKAYTYNKEDRQIIAGLAGSLADLRRYPQAREKYMQLESLGDHSAATYKQLMLLSFNLRQFPDAIKYASLLKKADPAEKVSYYIGKAHYDNDNYGEAIKHLTAAVGEEPGKAEIPYLVARSYADMMNYKQAIPYFEKAVALDPANTRWLYEVGLIYYAMHDDKTSLKYLLQAAEKGYKRDNEYLENLGIVYLNTGQTDKGLEILKEALQRRPSDLNLLNMLAEANYDAKRYDDAMGYWDQVLEMDKTNAQPLYMIGMCYQKKGDKQKGMALCDKAIQMDPSLANKKQKVEMPGGF
jgi:tetratricopeptide (TPR) repeat protein